MKRYLSILLAAVTIFTVSCKKDTTKDNGTEDTKANPTTITTAAPTATSTANIMPSEPPKSEEPTEETTTTIPETEAPTESAAPSKTQDGNMSTPTLVPSVDNTQSPSASEPTATVKPTAEPTVKPTSKPTVTVKPTVKPTATPTKAPTDEELKAYYKQQAANTVEEINKRRNVQLIVLPGLTKYAEYRAKQLVHNFAHDGVDQHNAATALQYGQYCDYTEEEKEAILYHWPDFDFTPYYPVPAAQAICKATGVSADFWNSPGHWSYVGSDEYLYIGVGASKGGTCVCVAAENTDLLK